MKSESSMSHSSPEQPGINSGPILEHDHILLTPEHSDKFSAERYEQIAEKSAISSDVGLTTVLPTPVMNQVVVAQNTTMDSMPTVTKDDNIIEKEIVAKAKKIVAETQNDPYRREEEVTELQKGYLKDRYGRELGATK